MIDVSYIQECIDFEVKIGDERYIFLILYRFSSKKKDEFENLAKNVKLTFEHNANKSQFLIVVLGDFNARMQCQYQNLTKRQRFVLLKGLRLV